MCDILAIHIWAINYRRPHFYQCHFLSLAKKKLTQEEWNKQKDSERLKKHQSKVAIALN